MNVQTVNQLFLTDPFERRCKAIVSCYIMTYDNQYKSDNSKAFLGSGSFHQALVVNEPIVYAIWNMTDFDIIILVARNHDLESVLNEEFDKFKNWIYPKISWFFS